MKKVIALLLALLMVVSLAACGGKTEKAETKTPSASNNNSSSNNSSTASKVEHEADGSVDVQIEAAEGVTKETLEGPFGEFVRYTTPHTEEMKMREPGTLYIGEGTVVESGNPHKGGANPFYELVFDKLIEYNVDTGKLQGLIFSDYKMADDNMSMSFTMHDNIYFHDGTHATVRDVFYTLERMQDPTISQLADKTVFGNIDIANCETIDDYHGVIKLFKPSVTLESGLTKCFLLCKDYIEKVGEDNAWWDNTVGTGPYKVDSIVQGDRYNISRFDNYWGGNDQAYFDKIVIRYYGEMATLLMDFETGYLDLIQNISATEVQMIADGDVPNTICEIYPMLNVYSIAFNEEMGNPALKDENVRKAICLAVDRATVNDFGWDLLGRPATSTVNSALSDSVPMAYDQDIEAAKAALADAGYKPGELHIVLGTHSAASVSRASEAIQNMLLEVGIDCELVTHDATVYIQNMRNAGQDTYDISLTSTMYETLESTLFLSSVSHSFGSTSYSCVTDEKCDELAQAVMEATSVEQKQERMKAVQEYIHDHYWYLPLVEPTSAVCWRDYLTGVRVMNPRIPDLRQLRLAD